MVNYFEFYGLAPSFSIDENQLKASYYQKMRELHPDMNMSASEEEKEALLAASSYNNKAYKCLGSFHQRLAYIVELHEEENTEDELKDGLPQEFLMEMMDVNEEIMELQFDPEPPKGIKIRVEILDQESEMRGELEKNLEGVELSDGLSSSLKTAITNYLLKRNYLLRIIENLDKFAPPID